MIRKWIAGSIACLVLGISAARAADEAPAADEGSGPIVSNVLNKYLHLDWSTTNVQYLRGHGYELMDETGGHSLDIITLEHANGWKYGDTFMFLDIADPWGNTDDANTSYYYEGYLRLSASKIFDTEISCGPLTDILLAGGINYGNHQDREYYSIPRYRAFLYGIGMDFAVPHFNFFHVDVYYKTEAEGDASYLQITPAYELPFAVGTMDFVFTGFCDFSLSLSADKGESNPHHSNIFSANQLLVDLGKFFDWPGYLYGGVEHQWTINKYGINGADEQVFQAMIKLKM